MAKFYMYQDEQGNVKTAEGPTPPAEFLEAKKRPMSWQPQAIQPPSVVPPVGQQQDVLQPPQTDQVPQQKRKPSIAQRGFDEYMSTVQKPQRYSAASFIDTHRDPFAHAKSLTRQEERRYNKHKREALLYGRNLAKADQTLKSAQKTEQRLQKKFDFELKKFNTLSPLEQQTAKVKLDKAKADLDKVKLTIADSSKEKALMSGLAGLYAAAKNDPSKLGAYQERAQQIALDPTTPKSISDQIIKNSNNLAKDDERLTPAQRITLLKGNRSILESHINTWNSMQKSLMTNEARAMDNPVVISENGTYVAARPDDLNQQAYAVTVNRMKTQAEDAMKKLASGEFDFENIERDLQPQRQQGLSLDQSPLTPAINLVQGLFGQGQHQQQPIQSITEPDDETRIQEYEVKRQAVETRQGITDTQRARALQKLNEEYADILADTE